MTLRPTLLRLFLLIAFMPSRIVRPANADPPAPFGAILDAGDFDPAAFAEWERGKETRVSLPDGPRHVVWTRSSAPSWDGLSYGESKAPGLRYLRIGWKSPVAIGSILAKGGGRASVLKPGAPYPGNLADESQWIPADRLVEGKLSREEAGRGDYALWVLPRVAKTRAIRFSHQASVTDRDYAGWIGGVFLLSGRWANLAPQAGIRSRSNPVKAGLIADGTDDGTWGAWDDGDDGAKSVVSPNDPEWIVLSWPRPVSIRGLNALWAGFGAVEVQAFAGNRDFRPNESGESDWIPFRRFDGIENRYACALGSNWLDFGKIATTRAIRLRITKATEENHPHLVGKTKGGKRVWLGELMALQPLGNAALKSILPPVAKPGATGHPPIPIAFTLKEPGYVTLVIEDASGVRVRNLVSETPFPAGRSVVWWDGLDDLGRNEDAAHHGVYDIPGKFVAPGIYRARGLYRKAIRLRYEFPVYSAGHPVWETEDHTGGWLANHTPPSSALFVPGERAPGGKPLVYLGCYVSEGTHGLAWVDLEGRKRGGETWVGGAWTAAPYLARDDGARRDDATFAYAGSAWGELRLTALTKSGEKPVLNPPYVFPGEPKDDHNPNSALSGLAVHDGLLIAALPRLNRLLFVDAKAGKILGEAELADPRGLAFDARGRLLALSGRRLLRFQLEEGSARLPAPEVVVSEGLEDPQGLTMDESGEIYVSDWGASHQIKVFSPEGNPLRAIGHPGAPRSGPYDPLHLNHPRGMTIDGSGRLWAAEEDFQPKRVSVWNPDGSLWKAFYGPAQYGGGGILDPKDKTRFYYDGMEFRLDWREGSNRLASVYARKNPGDALPDGFGTDGSPDAPVYAQGRQYMTNAYNSNPTNGASIAIVWRMKDGIAVPAAALGRASDWKVLKGDAFKSRWPDGVPQDGNGSDQALFVWADANGDGKPQPEETAFVRGATGGVTVMPDLSFVESRVDDRAMRYRPVRFSPDGVPFYDLAKGEVLARGAQAPTSSGGDQALVAPNGWTVLTVAPKPFAPQSLGGVFGGKPRWSYPSLWPGLHASHESPPPDRPGEIIGTTRLLGGFVSPRGSDAGPLWAVNGNQGNLYLFTADGLFVARLFQDIRQGVTWTMPVAARGMDLGNLTLHDENFWPSLTQAADGQVYLVDGARTSLVRVEGLDSIRRMPAQSLRVTAEVLRRARDFALASEAGRQRAEGGETLKVAVTETPPVVDGKLDEWGDADWATIDKRGVAAYFDSRSRPYDVTAAVRVSGDRLYFAFRTGDPNLLRNSGESPVAPFKTGGALDAMIGANPNADPNRAAPVEGDERLLVTQVKGKTRAVLYRAVVPGAKRPVPFSSPWRTIAIDSVEDASDQVRLAASGGDYEFSVPLSVLGLKPSPGMTVKGDLGILRGNGFQTLQRAYWSDKAAGIAADVPSEAELTPRLWGRWRFMEGR